VSETATCTRVGQAYLDALAVRDFGRIEQLLHPHQRFRGLVPGAVREGATAEETLSWLCRWFGDWEVLDLVQCSVDQVVDRLHLSYRAHVRDQEGWKEVAQHLYCSIEHGLMTDIALLCSGFRPLPGRTIDQQPSGSLEHFEEESRCDAHLFYDAEDQGCTEGPLERIAQLARSLSGGQTLEVRATNPSVAHDLPAWCRLAGYVLLYQDGDRYVIGRLRKKG
jgi:TusA-related sulfurtransferase